MSSRPIKVLMLTYEFTYSPFSGNGMLSRSLAKSLLSLGCTLRVVCCRPAAVAGLAADNHLTAPEVSDPSLIELWPVELGEIAGWRRLDDSSAYDAFWQGAAAMGSAAAAFAPDAVVAVDWTGAGAWRRLRESGWPTGPRPSLCYLNFRVYSSGLPPEAAEWFDAKEVAALEEASLVLALSPADVQSLGALQRRSASSTTTDAAPIHILMPPLRADVEALALQATPANTTSLPAVLASALALPGETRRFVTCGVRLSREKDPMRFVRFVEGSAEALRRLGLTPLLFGAEAEAEYAAEVKARLRAAFDSAVIISDFMGPPSLAAVFSATALNFHPCAYDAYGMSLVEAAAFGAPSLVNGGATIGAAQLLPGAQGASFELQLSGASDEAVALAALGFLEDRTRLEAVGAAARERALQWSEAAYGAGLHAHLERLGALAAPPFCE